MDFDIGSLSADQIRDLMARLQNLEVENDHLRMAASRVPTPAAQPPTNTGEAFMGLNPKIIPRPDKYDGDRKKNKVKEFVRKIERYLRCLPSVDASLHVDIISGFLTGPADTWFHHWLKSQTVPTATKLLDDLVSHFCPANVAQEARRKLAELSQRSSVEDFSRRFRDLLEEVDGIEEGEAKTYYVNGLKDAVKKEVLLKDLYGKMTLDEIDQMAIQIDAIVFRAKGHSRNSFYARDGSQGVAPMQGVQYNALSLEERSKLQREDRCFSCKQQKSHASGCRSRYIFRSNNLGVTDAAQNDDGPSETNA